MDQGESEIKISAAQCIIRVRTPMHCVAAFSDRLVVLLYPLTVSGIIDLRTRTFYEVPLFFGLENIMNRMEVSKQRKTTPLRHAFIKDLVARDPEWATHCTFEEIIQAADILLQNFYHVDDRESVLLELEKHFTAQCAATIAVNTTRSAVKLLETYGADINPDLAKAILKKSVFFAVEIMAAMYGELGKLSERFRFIERRVLHLASRPERAGVSNG